MLIYNCSCYYSIIIGISRRVNINIAITRFVQILYAVLKLPFDNKMSNSY